jgi:probable addiction module antidote protein
MSEMKLTRWDVIDHWETDEDIVAYLQVVLEDGLPELVAAALVDIARAKGLFATDGRVPRGKSLLEKAIENSYLRNPDGKPKVWTLHPPVPEGTNSD